MGSTAPYCCMLLAAAYCAECAGHLLTLSQARCRACPTALPPPARRYNGSASGYRYMLNTHLQDFETAEAMCQEHGGHLASLGTVRAAAGAAGLAAGAAVLAAGAAGAGCWGWLLAAGGCWLPTKPDSTPASPSLALHIPLDGSTS